MWDLPRPGLEPVSPALAGRFSTTVPPGKPWTHFWMSWLELGILLASTRLRPGMIQCSGLCKKEWSDLKCQQCPGWETLLPRILLSAVDRTGFLLRPISLVVKKWLPIVIFLVGVYGEKGWLPFALSWDQGTFSPTEESKFQGFISEINE